MKNRIVPGIYLLRKSKQGDGEQVPVLKDADFPMRFAFGEKTFEISKTKSGRLIMQAASNK